MIPLNTLEEIAARTRKGVVDILNVGAGHAEISFNSEKPEEVQKAQAAVTDMLRRGYALFVAGESGAQIKVLAFDATKNRYIIGDVPEAPKESEPLPAKKKGGRPRRALAAGQASVTAVAPSAGG